MPFEFPEPGDGPAYLVSDIHRRLATAVLVYGTEREAGANRYAAEQMQTRFLDQYESRCSDLQGFRGLRRPAAPSRRRLRRPPRGQFRAGRRGPTSIGLDYSGAAFRIDGAVHASEREALLLAAKNPLDAAHMVLVVAGNDALRTVKAWAAGLPQTDHVILK